MSEAANAIDSPRGDDKAVVAALVTAKWLHFAAAPTLMTMALLTVVFDSGSPNGLCSAAGSLRLSGMAPMYLLMATFHLRPWLKLISRRRNLPGMTLFQCLDRSIDIQTVEQNR
jgi:hypothetical protein